MNNENWKVNVMLEVVRKGMRIKKSFCHGYLYGVLNRELISDPLISKRYTGVRKDTEKDNNVNQKSETASAQGEIKWVTAFSLEKRLLRCLWCSSFGDDYSLSHSLCSVGSVMVLLDIWLKVKRKHFFTQPVMQLRNSLPYDVSDVKVEIHRANWMDLEQKGHNRPPAQSSFKHLLAGKMSCGQQGSLCAMFPDSSICW